MINSVIITGDVLRPLRNVNGVLEGNQNWNINNRYLLFRHLFKAITDLTVEKCYWNSEESFDTPYFYQLLGCSLVDELSWFAIYKEQNLPEEAEKYLLKFFQNAFIVGFELPPILCNFFIRNNIPYVKLIDYPIRFLDDTIVGISSNNSDIFKFVKTYQLEEEGFYMHAALAKIRLRSFDIIEDDSAIFFGQTPIDLSLYHEGKCLNVLDFQDEIISIAQNHRKLYFKMHPYVGGNSDALNEFIKKHNIEIINHNSYMLLANDRLKTAVSISSSVLEEAKYFYKKTLCLHKMPYRYALNDVNEEFDSSIHVPIGSEILFPNFWFNIFKCLDLNKERTFKDRLSFESNTFRFSLAAMWGYDALYKPHWLIDRKIESVIHTVNQYRISSEALHNDFHELKNNNHALKADFYEFKGNNDGLLTDFHELKESNLALKAEASEYKNVTSILINEINSLKEINKILKIENNKSDVRYISLDLEVKDLKETNNILAQNLKDTDSFFNIKIKSIEDNMGILNFEFKDFKLQCHKLYKKKILPKLQYLFLKIRDFQKSMLLRNQ